jgi:5-methylcytosine-specific restriction protein A
MLESIDISLLCSKLENRFQIALYSQPETVDGGEFNALRLVELEQGNGFAILLSRTHSQFEASFKADNFAGSLLRVMSEVGDEQKKALFRARTTAGLSGAQVYLAVNGNDGDNCLDLKDRWTRLEVDVYQRFPSRKTPDELLATAFTVVSTCLSIVLALAGIGEKSSAHAENMVIGLPEGAKLRVEVNRYERSPVNRAACLEHLGVRCQCCDFDFAEVYGELGDGYIEVHHVTPVSKMGQGYIVDPISDLVPLCGNCHSMVHRTAPPMQVSELRELIALNKVAAKSCGDTNN